MASFIELIAKIKQKNNGTFKLVDAQDVECEDGKGLDEVLNEKLDKNLGAENKDKVLVTDVEGNITTQNKENFEGGGTSDYNDLENKPQINGVELKGNKTSGDLKMYTQEEVDYMLADKMDKPYVPIEITDNATITDSLEGNFKIDSIKGKSVQTQETDIIPTPNRPVPINSRKTLVTKANLNVFDLEKESDTSSIPDTGTYRSIGQYQLKANTKYIFEWTEATVPAKATLSFQIQDDKGTVLVSPFTYFNLQTDEKKEAGKEVEFTTNSSGIVKFAYNCTVGTSSTTETYQQYWYTKILKDISLKEDVEYATEYVELRSLKETINKFDLGLLSQVDLIPDNRESYRKIEIPIKLKPNTRYKIYYEKSMIPALTWTVLNIVDNTKKNIAAILNVRNTENNEIEKPAINSAFTSPDDGEIYFSYYVQSYNTEGVLVPQTIETFKEKWFTKIIKNIMVTEESLNQNTYVPPTVRDYKIVDHTTQTSKIVRNIGIANLTNLTWTYGYRDLNHIRCYAKPSTPLKFVEQYCYCNVFENIYSSKYDYSKEAIYLGNNMGDKTISIMANQDVFAGQTQEQFDRLLKEYINNPNAITLYALETPTEEEIAYSADDVSEVGYSWQDTTSPSPTIPAEVKGVEKIDILKTGKNLFDIKSHEFTTNLQSGKVSANRIVKVNDTTLRVQNPNVESYAVGDKFVVKANKPLIISFDILEITGTEQINVVFYKETGSLLKSFEYRTIKVGTRFVIDTPITTRNNYVYIGFQSVDAGSIVTISNILLEHASIATAYEPYTEQHINITPPQPMYSILDGSIADEVDVEKGVYRYWLLKDKIENLATAVNFAQKHGNFQSYFITKVKDNSLKPITLLGIEDTRNLICNKCNVNLLDYNNEKETFSLYVDKSAVFVGNINIERLNENTTSDIYNFIKDFEIVYPLLTPIEIPIPQEDLKLLKSLKTEQGVTNIFVGGEVKPTIEARYPRDLALVQQQLEQKILLISDSLIDTQAKLLLQGGN